MNMTIPQTEGLSTNAMNRVFDTTTATYKFYWLLALLDMRLGWLPTLGTQPSISDCRLARAIPCRRLFPMWLC